MQQAPTVAIGGAQLDRVVRQDPALLPLEPVSLYLPRDYNAPDQGIDDAFAILLVMTQCVGRRAG